MNSVALIMFAYAVYLTVRLDASRIKEDLPFLIPIVVIASIGAVL